MWMRTNSASSGADPRVTDAVPESAIVVDTGVFSIDYVTAGGLQYHGLRDRLAGSIPLIATETEAELRSWPQLRGWGENRARRLSEILKATRTVPIAAEVDAVEGDQGSTEGDRRRSDPPVPGMDLLTKGVDVELAVHPERLSGSAQAHSAMRYLPACGE